MTRNKKTSLLESRAFRIAVSVFAAVIFWTVISATKTTVAERTVTAVPVQLQFPSDFKEETGLSVYGESSFTVDVTVSGPSYIVNASSFGNEDISVSASAAEVAAPGEYELPVTAKTSGDNIKVVKLSAQTVKVNFDESVTKTFPLTESVTEGEGYSLAAGLIRENPTISCDTIDVTGPSAEIAKITSVRAEVVLDSEIKASTRLEAKIVFETDDAQLDESNLEYNKEEKIYITVPVSKSGVYDVKVDFTNVPADYREKGIEYSITPSSANIVVSSGSHGAVIGDDGTVTVGTIDCSKINNEVNYIRVVCDNIGEEPVTFTVRIDMSSMYKRWIEIPVDTSNAELPANVKVNSTSVKSVQIVGPEASVKNVDSSVAYAVPVLDGVDLKTPGTYTVPAKIILRALTNAWIYNTYQLEITVS